MSTEPAKQDWRDTLPVRRYTKEELLAVLSGVDAAKTVTDGSEEETAIVTAAVSDDLEIRDMAARVITSRFRHIERFEKGKTSFAEDCLVSLAVEMYTSRPTGSAFVLKKATLSMALRQLTPFYLIEAQNFYKTSGDIVHSLEDYQQEAATCIFEKIGQYDPSKGKLSTFYKPQFYGVFMMLQSGNSKKYYSARVAKINRARAELVGEGIDAPTKEQIAQWINRQGGTREVSPRQVETALKTQIRQVPIEAVSELQSLIPGTEEIVMRNDTFARARQAARELDPILRVVCYAWLQSLEDTGTDISDKDLKAAVKAKFPQMTDQDVKQAKSEFLRQMRRKLSGPKPVRRTAEKIRNTSEANISLLDAIAGQYPNGLPGFSDEGEM